MKPSFRYLGLIFTFTYLCSFSTSSHAVLVKAEDLQGLEWYQPEWTGMALDVPTLEEATRIFHELRVQDRLALCVSEAGCGPRAILTYDALETRNIPCMGISAKPQQGKGITIQTPWFPGRSLSWGFHWATALPVVLSEQPLTIQEMVFDLGLMEGPVPRVEWINRLEAASKEKNQLFITYDRALKEEYGSRENQLQVCWRHLGMLHEQHTHRKKIYSNVLAFSAKHDLSREQAEKVFQNLLQIDFEVCGAIRTKPTRFYDRTKAILDAWLSREEGTLDVIPFLLSQLDSPDRATVFTSASVLEAILVQPEERFQLAQKVLGRMTHWIPDGELADISFRLARQLSDHASAEQLYKTMIECIEIGSQVNPSSAPKPTEHPLGNFLLEFKNSCDPKSFRAALLLVLQQLGGAEELQEEVFYALTH